jgi:bifunctional non-homologous end joining protein LigD
MSSDPYDWRPLEARSSARKPSIVDPIIEPLWQGTRVLAHYRAAADGDGPGTIELRDGEGYDVTEEFAEISAALAGAIFARDAVIDGILTDQAMAGGVGVGVVPEAKITSMGMLLGKAAEVTVTRPPSDTTSEVSFVALDLLSVDGEPLLDLPLLERKRELEGLLVSNDLARSSPFARPPLAQWFNSWKSAGFNGVVMKAANSRYRPDEVARKWAIVERVGNR